MIKIHIGKINKGEVEILFLDSLKNLSKDEVIICEIQGFGAKSGESIFLQQSAKLCVGVSDFGVDSIREAAAYAIRRLKNYNVKSAKISGFDNGQKNYALMIGFLLGEYEFSSYKKSDKKMLLKDLYIVDSGDFNKELNMANIVAESTNFVRQIVNTPPQDCTPIVLAKEASSLAKKRGMSVKIGDLKFLQKEKMNAFLAVAKASNNEPRLIHLTYKPKNPKGRIVLVGKGLTYDSGGLSLKPADYMTTMKADKSGGCAVLGIMSAISQLKVGYEIHGIIGACENMIGGNAYKPDDILHTREGISVEVKNTDAEGRLVLIDCLSYAQDLKPDYLIDLATLTGACVVALGEYTSGIMGYNDKLKKKFETSSLKSGELASILPFNRHLEKLIESKNADVSNISSSRYGGAITAGLFLGKFIREKYRDSWLHLDIAGPAFVEKEWDINPYGGSGAGVRSVIEFIMDLEA